MPRRVPILRATAPLVLAALAALAGCDSGPGSVSIPYESPAEQPPSKRIVSLSPAITRMIVDMGKAQNLVGVAEHDASAPKAAAVLGNAFSPDAEKLLHADPTHVLVMAGPGQVPAALSRLAESKRFEVIVYPYPRKIEDVMTMLFDPRTDLARFVPPEAAASPGAPQTPPPPPVASLGSLLEDVNRGIDVAKKLSARLEALSQVTRSQPQPRVLMVVGVEPEIVASGVGTVLHELLTMHCGAINAAIPKVQAPDKIDSKQIERLQKLDPTADPAHGVGVAPTFDKEKLLAAAPDVVLLLLPGAPPLQDIESDPRLAKFRGLDIPAVKQKRFVLLNDPQIHLVESSAMASVGAIMVKAIHPTLAGEVDRAMELPANPANTAGRADAPKQP